MPPVLRIWTGADCPRKKTVSGKIFDEISAALRMTSLLSAAMRGGEGKALRKMGRTSREAIARIDKTRRGMCAPLRLEMLEQVSMLHKWERLRTFFDGV